MNLRHLGKISFHIDGAGPLVVCVPGMGDLRSSYRFLAPALVRAGYRVAVIDLRGHGDSSDDFDSYDDAGNADDVATLIRHLGGPAVVIGNSMGAAIGVLVAAAQPALVSGLVLIGPFVRNGRVNPALRAIMRVATSRPFVAGVWNMYLPSLFAGRKPADFDGYRAQVVESTRRHAGPVSTTMQSRHDGAEAALPRVHTAVLVVMGELDPDFRSPRGEAEWIIDQLGGSIIMVPEAGHYPHSQRPDVVVPAVTSFLSTVSHNA
jgi:pimeloyl-ACP methyl ester carboxylesterase